MTPAFTLGQPILYKPFWTVNVAVRAVYVEPVANDRFPDVPLHRIRLLEPVAEVTLPGYNGKPDSVYPALPAGHDYPNALTHEIEAA